jgi:biopolymer transport protein ExbB
MSCPAPTAQRANRRPGVDDHAHATLLEPWGRRAPARRGLDHCGRGNADDFDGEPTLAAPRVRNGARRAIAGRASTLRLIAVLLLVVLGLDMVAAETPAAVRAQAETAATATRLRIADERAAQVASLQQALAEADVARRRLAAAQAARDAARADTAARRRVHEQAVQTLRQLVDRAVVAARLGAPAAGTTPQQRAEAAVAAVDARLAALAAALGRSQADESIFDRQGRPVSAPVLRLGRSRAVALGPDDASRGLLEPAASGQGWRVVGPRLDPLPAGRIALDPDGRAAQVSAPGGGGIAGWLAAGRFFIWPIIGVFAIAIAIVVWRTAALARLRVDPLHLARIAGLLAGGKRGEAAAAVAGGTTPLDRILAAGIAATDRPREAREALVERALIVESSALRRGLPAVLVLAGVCPLLGLLGTVTGMIDMFGTISTQGAGGARAVSGGISEALVTTQAGMLAAIPLLLLHALLARAAERREELLEEAACGVLGLTATDEAARG